MTLEIAILQALPGKGDDLAKIVAEHLHLFQSFSGVSRLEVWQGETTSEQIVLNIHWSSTTAHERFKTTSAFSEWITALRPAKAAVQSQHFVFPALDPG